MGRNANWICLWIAICLCCESGVVATAQNNFRADSLRKLLVPGLVDTSRINNLNYLGWELKKSDIDTSILLSKQAVKLAENFSKDRSSTPEVIRASKTALANALGNLGVYYRNKSEFDTALAYLFRALKLDKELNYKKGLGARLGNIGLVYSEIGNYPKALDNYFEALKIGEETGDKARIAIQYGNIGIVYHDQGELKKALEYYLKALKLGEELKNEKSVALRLGNIGLVYEEMGDKEKALGYYERAFSIFEKLRDKNGMGIWLGNMANIYKERKEDERAMDCYMRALKLRQEAGSKSLVASCLGNIGGLYTLKKNYSEAFSYLQQAIALSSEAGALYSLKMQYKMTSTLYEQSTVSLRDTIGGKLLNMEEMRLRSLYYYKKSIAIADTLFSEENKKHLVQKEMIFEFEKKEAFTKAENLRNAERAEVERKKQKAIIISVACCLFLVVGFAIFILRALRVTRKQKKLIEKQKTLVDEKQKEILDSIYYARRIQRALITSERYIDKNWMRGRI